MFAGSLRFPFLNQRSVSCVTQYFANFSQSLFLEAIPDDNLKSTDGAIKHLRLSEYGNNLLIKTAEESIQSRNYLAEKLGVHRNDLK